jgi:hypothetical protein
MSLRPVSELGLIDATDVSPVIHDERELGPSAEPATRSRSLRPAHSRRSSNGAASTQTGADAPSTPPLAKSKEMPLVDESTEPNRVALTGQPSPVDDARARQELPLADEPPTFLQIMVPGELHERLADVSHVLAADHRKLRHHKTILGALIWRHVDPDDGESLREVGTTLDAYLSTDLAEAPAEIKAGAHLPFSLKYRLDGAAIALRRTRRDASAKTLLSALIWRHVDPQDVAPLIELLADYYDIARPRPLPLGHGAGGRLPPQE